MTIVFGRRRLILTLVSTPPEPKRVAFPEAESATDAELARLGTRSVSVDDRRRWEVTAILYGGFRPR
ncbi:MAG TPA: hypothetical protein VIL01_07125 [Thermomicrobiales bacterium]